jgi:lipopolysaccharide biosynthesis protein
MFEYEVGQVDGTLAHAVERVLAAAAAKSSFRTEEL